MSHYPFDLLIIMLGTNDFRPHICNKANAIATGVANLADMARQAIGNPQLPVLLISPAPISEIALESDLTLSQINEESVIESQKLAVNLYLCAQLHNCYFLDAADYVSASEIDAIHLSAESHLTLAEAVAKMVMSIL